MYAKVLALAVVCGVGALVASSFVVAIARVEGPAPTDPLFIFQAVRVANRAPFPARTSSVVAFNSRHLRESATANFECVFLDTTQPLLSRPAANSG